MQRMVWPGVVVENGIPTDKVYYVLCASIREIHKIRSLAY